MRLLVAIWAAKLVRTVVRLTGRGQGSTLPGAIALRIAPNLIGQLAKSAPVRVVVTGTNGKTTTTHLITSILRTAGWNVVANETSANLASGIASVLVSAARGGRLQTRALVLEVDEHVVPGIVEQIRPTLICFTNLFRDQLDRYGEVQNVARRWQTALTHLDAQATIVSNANDPHLALLGCSHRGPVSWFGVPGGVSIGRANHSASDAVRCPQCGGALTGERYMAHLGWLRCGSCTFTTATPDVAVTGYQPRGRAFEGSSVTLTVAKQKMELQTNLVGRYNALNVAAAVAVTSALAISVEHIKGGIAQARRVFGRSEVFVASHRTVLLHLAKNPTGYNEVLASITDIDPAPAVLLALNDNWADGQDVSWIWDVDFEQVAPSLSAVSTTGQRSGDLAVRLEVAGVPGAIHVEANLEKAFDRMVLTAVRKPLHIIASYTAMLMLRGLCAERGYLQKNWHA